MQVLVSATSSAAKAIGVGDKVGTLKPGMLADVLVLSANPLDDIKNTRKIVSIWQGGALVSLKREPSSSTGQ
jgi:imidazolonepropionase-like amidohydrolase